MLHTRFLRLLKIVSSICDGFGTSNSGLIFRTTCSSPLFTAMHSSCTKEAIGFYVLLLTLKKAFVKMFSIYSCSMLYQQITSLMVAICNKLFLQFLEFIDQCPITTAVRLSPPTPQFCRMPDFCTSGIINLQKEFCELT